MFYLEQLLGKGKEERGDRVRKGTRQDEENRAYWVFRKVKVEVVVLVKIREKFTTKMESNGISLPVCCWYNDTFSLFPLSLSPTSHFTFFPFL